MTGSQVAIAGGTFAAVAPYLARYGYLAVIAGVGLESAGVPLPGETTLLAASAVAASGAMNVWLVAAAGAAASMMGDNFGFAIGRLGGRRALTWLEGRALPRRSLERMDGFFDRWGPFAVVVARFVTGVRVVAAIAAGASGMRWRTFLPYNATGAVLWAGAVTAVGYLAGDLSRLVHPGVLSVNRAVIIAVTLLLIALVWIALRRRLLEGRPGTRGEDGSGREG